MKNLFFISSLIIHLANATYAQNNFPNALTNPSWRVHIAEFISARSYIYDYQLGSDTIIFNNIYQKIISRYPPNYVAQIDGFIRVVGKKVFIIKNKNPLRKEKLMYDFSLNLGDTIYCAFTSIENFADTTKCWVQSVDSITIKNIKRKVLSLKFLEGSFEPIEMQWIEGIGSNIGPFYPFYCLSAGCEIKPTLLCYENASTSYFTNANYSDCDLPITSTKEYFSDDEVNIYPKLTTNNLTIKNNSGGKLKAQVVNSVGQILIRTLVIESQVELDTQNIPNGIYIIHFSNGSKHSNQKFVKN